jgi:vacuolar-type H+-ATPase catalytic subunit A/Vma1
VVITPSTLAVCAIAIVAAKKTRSKELAILRTDERIFSWLFLCCKGTTILVKGGYGMSKTVYE